MSYTNTHVHLSISLCPCYYIVHRGLSEIARKLRLALFRFVIADSRGRAGAVSPSARWRLQDEASKREWSATSKRKSRDIIQLFHMTKQSAIVTSVETLNPSNAAVAT